ncbi:MAG: methyltransferase [Cyclobacteriaceae bacterium]|nr:methyltransferase [Cyclobacteriaceae bacterium]
MKVTSMACIQGAWIPEIQPKSILDIGAGTGVLSLMCAQRFGVAIDAVEIEEDAFQQLRENIAQSPWPEVIRPIHADICSYGVSSGKSYDFIITNPPFYKDQLKSPFDKVNQARHDTSLKLNDLAGLLPNLIHENGIISILLPPSGRELLHNLALAHGLYIYSELHISEQMDRPVKAIIFLLRKSEGQQSIHRFHIRQESGDYSEQYISLMRPYYLHL